MAASGSNVFVSELVFRGFGKKHLDTVVNDERLTQRQRNFLTFLQQGDTAQDLDWIKFFFYKSVFELLLLNRDSLKETKYALGYISPSWWTSFDLLLNQFKDNKEDPGEKNRISEIQKLIAKILKKESSPGQRIAKVFKSESSESLRGVVCSKMGVERLSKLRSMHPILQAIKKHDEGPSVYLKLFYQTDMVLRLINLIDRTKPQSQTTIKNILFHYMVLSGLSSLKTVILEFGEYYKKIGLTVSGEKCRLLLNLINEVKKKRKNLQRM